MTLDDVISSAAAKLERGGPGFAVGVARNGRLLAREAFGMASVEHGVVNTPQTRMRLASITKHMAAVGALLLADEGRLDLDAPAERILPELPRPAGAATLRQMMSHCAGNRCPFEMGVIGAMRHVPARWCLSLMFRQQEASFEPGERQLYNNGGYELLSEAIVRASGQPFEDFMLQRVFAPLGMQDTVSLPDDTLLLHRMATAHVATPGGYRRGITQLEDNRGPGAVVSTVDDMLRWTANLRGPRRAIGSDRVWRELTEVSRLRHGFVTTYALGLYRHRYRGAEVVHHGGGLAGVATQMLIAPEHGVDIVVLCNGGAVNPVELGWRLLDAVLGDELSGEPAPLASSAGFEHLFGARYLSPDGLVYGFDDAGGQLGLTFLGTPPLPVLRDRGEQIGFLAEEAGLGPLLFSRAALRPGPQGGAPARLDLEDAGLRQELTLLPREQPDTLEAGHALLGTYDSPDLGGTARVLVRDGALQLDIRVPGGGRTLTVEALTRRTFLLKGADPEMPAFFVLNVASDAGARPGSFRIETPRVRRLLFTRRKD